MAHSLRANMHCIGIFQDTIKHLLVVTTALEIFLLGISVGSNTPTGSSEVVFYVTKMSIPSDNIIMTSIVGTDSGRIFTCGSDGHIYELCYGVSNRRRRICKQRVLY